MTDQGRPSVTVLTRAPGAPPGGIEGCPGYLVLDIERNNCGSWSTACSVDLSVYCESPGCWWSRMVEGPVTAQMFALAKQEHDADTLWPSDVPAQNDQGDLPQDCWPSHDR